MITGELCVSWNCDTLSYYKKSEAWRSPDEASHFVEPTILVDESLTVRWGRYELGVFYNPGHTMSTLNVDIPGADLIHAADTIVGNLVYLFYSNPSSMHAALVRLRQRARATLVTSHGGPRRIVAADHALHYLDLLEMQVRAARLGESSRDAILAIDLDDCLPAGVEGSDFERIFHRRNLETIIERRFFSSVRDRKIIEDHELPQVETCG